MPDVLRQVAALPVRLDPNDRLRVLLETSRETKRFIIPKGWPIKGMADHDAAAKEADEEAGVVGQIRHEPVGGYAYWKRLDGHFKLCEVAVFLLEVERQKKKWREMGQREYAWLLIDDAADLVEEPGLVAIIRDLTVLDPSLQSRECAKRWDVSRGRFDSHGNSAVDPSGATSAGSRPRKSTLSLKSPGFKR